MRHTFRLAPFSFLFAGFLAASSATPAPAGQYKNFRVAVYCVVDATQRFADEKVLQAEFDRVMARVKFDKVYLDVYRNKRFADEATLDKIKRFFGDRGVIVEGGLTLAAGGTGGQFGTFDFEKPEDRAECKKAVQIAARHFDTVILDDFFFYTSKSDADIAAKGNRSWTQYRLQTMRMVSTELVLKPEGEALFPRSAHGPAQNQLQDRCPSALLFGVHQRRVASAFRSTVARRMCPNYGGRRLRR